MARDYRKFNCLLLYNIYSAAEAETVHDNIESLSRFSRHRVLPVWMLGGLPPAIEIDRFDVIVIHYSIKVHYDYFMSPETRSKIAAFKGLKILFAQDEYYMINRMNEVMGKLGIHVVFSVTPEQELDKVYSPDTLSGLKRVTILTGYVPDRLPYIEVKHWKSRSIDIGYRARKLSAWLGERGQEKWRIGDRFQEDAKRYGLRTDISCQESDRLYGRHWLHFLSSCKAVLGTGSGGSVLDYTGEVQDNVVKHETEHPETPFEVLRELYLADADGAVLLDVISPRCFEAASLRTLMIMYEGWYSGVLTPWRHYVPLKRDHSNMDDVIAVLRDEDRALSIIENAYKEVALNASYSYASMVALFDQILDETIEPTTLESNNLGLARLYPAIGLVSRLKWHAALHSMLPIVRHMIGRQLWQLRFCFEAWWGRHISKIHLQGLSLVGKEQA